MSSRGAVQERQIRSAFVQFCLRHGSGNGSGICATIGRAHKSAMCAGSTRTLDPLIMPTAKETNNFRLKIMCISLTHGRSIPGVGIWNQPCDRGNGFFDQRITEVPELVMATGFPALI